jgi:hypothetical protein
LSVPLLLPQNDNNKDNDDSTNTNDSYNHHQYEILQITIKEHGPLGVTIKGVQPDEKTLAFVLAFARDHYEMHIPMEDHEQQELKMASIKSLNSPSSIAARNGLNVDDWLLINNGQTLELSKNQIVETCK